MTKATQILRRVSPRIGPRLFVWDIDIVTVCVLLCFIDPRVRKIRCFRLWLTQKRLVWRLIGPATHITTRATSHVALCVAARHTGRTNESQPVVRRALQQVAACVAVACCSTWRSACCSVFCSAPHKSCTCATACSAQCVDVCVAACVCCSGHASTTHTAPHCAP